MAERAVVLGGHKKLRLPDAVAQSVGFMGPVFSSAFLIPLLVGVNASGTGAGAAAPLSVVISTIGVLGLGWIISEYARRIHAAGSLYDYVTDGLGARIGAGAGFAYYGGILALGAAILVLIGGTIHDTLQAEFNIAPIPTIGWDLILLIGIGALLYAGVSLSTRTQLVLAVISLLVVTVFFIKVIAKVGSHNSLLAFSPSTSPTGMKGILFGVLYGVLLFTGFETAANLGEETEHPKRDIPRAVLFALLLAAGFYILASYAQVAGFHFSLKEISKAASGPLFVLGSPPSQGGYGSDWIRRLLELVVVLDMLAVYIGVSVSASRGIFAMARDSRLPGRLTTISATRKTPVGASTLVVAVYAIVIGVTEWWTGLFSLPQTPHYAAMFSWLATFGPFALALVYLLMTIGAVRGLADHPRRWAVWLASVVGAVTVISALFGSIYKVPMPTVSASWAALGWFVVGMIVMSVIPAKAKGASPATEAAGEIAVGS